MHDEKKKRELFLKEIKNKKEKKRLAVTWQNIQKLFRQLAKSCWYLFYRDKANVSLNKILKS